VRRIDQKNLLDDVVRDVLDEKQTAVDELKKKDGLVFVLGGNAQFQFDFEMGRLESARLQIDSEIDRWALRQRCGCAGILEREILDVLADDLDARLQIPRLGTRRSISLL
jgi:hypothetical protein